MLTSQEQQEQAELTSQRAEQIGWDNDRVMFFKTKLALYKIPNQIKFYEFGRNQDLDEIIVSDFFKATPTGRFLCVGSANGIDQTYSLLQKGWSGVYCEPDPAALVDPVHGLFCATKEFNDNVVIVNAAITATSNVCNFYINKTIALSTTKKDLSNSDSIPIIINSCGVNQLLDYIGEDFDYVQIDAEGADTEIINAIDWSQRLPNCKLIGVEAGIENWQQLLNQGNYVIAAVTEHNMYFRRLDL
tara:strand:+ start:2169 stop:2903 length:735 start_codon:yes stop_codon:yes gene_type:complete